MFISYRGIVFGTVWLVTPGSRLAHTPAIAKSVAATQADGGVQLQAQGLSIYMFLFAWGHWVGASREGYDEEPYAKQCHPAPDVVPKVR